MENFFNKLFDILKIPTENRKKLLEDLQELINFRAITVLLENLPEEKHSSLKKLSETAGITKENFQQWLKDEKILQKDELVRKLDATVKATFVDYFKAITQDLSKEKKREVKHFAKSFV